MKTWPIEDSLPLALPDRDPEEITISRDLSAYLNQLIDGLPPPYRLLLALYHIHDFSYQEIEEITGMPSGTVKGTLFRARKLLKEKLTIFLKKENI